jgi:predicted aminopeptidase
LLAALLQSIAACSSLRFYGQAVSGQLSLMGSREPIQKLLDEEQLSPSLRAKLTLVQEVRQFAGTQLGLPIEGQYTTYADLGRPYVVWNVFAAPEFSISPVEWCFPVAGCVSYRGYFRERAALDFAEKLRKQGLDVYVGGVAAYSSLGWFSDPVLNTLREIPISTRVLPQRWRWRG